MAIWISYCVCLPTKRRGIRSDARKVTIRKRRNKQVWIDAKSLSGSVERDARKRPKHRVSKRRTPLWARVATLAGSALPFKEVIMSEKPYIADARVIVDLKYNPNYGDHRLCLCGRPYHRHFDSYDAMRNVGCKYCCCFQYLPKK